MKGTIIAYEAARGVGVIAPEDGSRQLGFRVEDVEVTKGLEAGREVSYTLETGDWYADKIRLKDAPRLPRSRRKAALIAIFGGIFGLQKFYMGYPLAGIGILVGIFFLWGLVLPVLLVIWLGITEGIIYLRLTDEQFDRRYLQGRRAWL